MASPLSSQNADMYRFMSTWYQQLSTGQFGQISPIRKKPGAGSGRSGRSLWTRSVNEAISYADSSSGNEWDVYLGTLPRRRTGNAIADVGAKIWLWGELDFGSDGHSKSPFATEREAREALAKVPAKPTMLVHSGGGLHAWWCLYAEPLDHEWQQAQDNLAKLFGAHSTSAANQILRIPGTANWKTGTPRPVTLLWCDEDNQGHDIDPFLSLDLGSEKARPSGGERHAGGGDSLPSLDERPRNVWTVHEGDAPAKAQEPKNRPYELAKDVPIHLVLEWLGVKLHRDGSTYRSACPVHGGKNETSLQVGGERNVATCYSRCNRRTYTTVDMVAGVRRVTSAEAVNLLAERFGFSGLTAKQKDAAQRPALRVFGGGETKEEPKTAENHEVNKKVTMSGGDGGGSPLNPTEERRGGPPPGGDGRGGGSSYNGYDGGGGRDRPTIRISTEEYWVGDQAVEALGESGEPLYTRGYRLVQVIGGERLEEPIMIEQLPSPQIRRLLSKVARWVRHNRDGMDEPAHVPDWVVSDVGSRGVWGKIRPLRGVVSWPILRPDGSVLASPGYDLATGVLYRPIEGLGEVRVGRGEGAIRGAVETLIDVVCDFPFDQVWHKSAWLASVLTTLGRYAFRGPSPCFLLDGNIQGAGKTLLAKVAADLVTGRDIESFSQHEQAGEEKKAITSFLMSGRPVFLIDNVKRQLGGGNIELLFTSDQWTDRELGGNKVASIPNLATWFASGNNVSLSRDMCRRVLPIRLKSQAENPEERTKFKHNPIQDFVYRHRAKLLSAAFTILAGFCEAGRPSQPMIAMGSYESWSALIRGAIIWAGLPDPAQGCAEVKLVSESEQGAYSDLLAGWEETGNPADGLTAAEVVKMLDESKNQFGLLRESIMLLLRLPSGKSISAHSLGMKLGRICDRNIGGKRLVMVKKAKGVQRWLVEKVPASEGIAPSSEGIAPSSDRGKPEPEDDNEFRV